MTITTEQVLSALSQVMDPDLKKDLVSLHMIENVQISSNHISWDVVLTTPACPLKDKIRTDCEKAVKSAFGEGITMQINMTSRVVSHRSEKPNLLPEVKNIIAVASGKGGVGKSTVAANLAVALGRTGAKVALVDADIYGPSVPIMFGLQNEKIQTTEFGGKAYLLPFEKFGIKLMSIGFLVDPSQALVWRGPMASNALKQLFTDTQWEEIDYMVVDMPPGTGDIHLTLVQQLNIAGVLIVTTPQEVALADARKGIAMFRSESVQIPILGLVENMSWFTPAELPQNRYHIFGKEGAKRLALEFDVPLVGQIPIVQSICESGDQGIPPASGPHSPISDAFASLAGNVVQQLAIISENAG